MAHYRRKRPRDKTRWASSDWTYPQIEKGSYKRSRYSRKLAATNANERMKEYKDDVGTIHYYG